VTPFRQKGAKTFKMRITLPDRRSGIFSCGTSDPVVARDVSAMVKRMKKRRDWGPLTAVIERKVTLARLYDAHEAGSLARLMADLSDLDLSPLVTEWDGKGKRSRSEKYVRQVRRMIPEGGRYPVSLFTRGAVKKFLDGLDCDNPTKNRYKAALAQFARWLVQRDVIASNVVRDVDGYGENDPRDTWLTPEQQQALVGALAGEARIAAAIMAGTGMEWGALQAARRRDVDLDNRTIHAQGGKNRWRNRIVDVTEEWAWAIIEPSVRLMAPASPVITITERAMWESQQHACEALGLPHHTLHDWRHSYAVNAILRGDDEQQIRKQLGHAPNSGMLKKVYGVYFDRAKRGHTRKAKVTNSAT
jgi:integrase